MKKLCLLLAVLLALLCSLAMAADNYPEGVLYRGIKDHKEEVEELQYQLFYAGYLGDDLEAAVDGIFGKGTEAAVKAYQKANGLKADGVAWTEVRQLLAAEWENGMEPQGGEEIPYCYVEYYADGAQSVVICSWHKQVYTEATAAVNQAEQNDEQLIEGLQTAIVFWMEELKSVYQQWEDQCPEYAQQITAHQEAFMNYYRAQLAVWNAQFGSPSMAALEKAMEMLAEQCSDLCVILSGAM